VPYCNRARFGVVLLSRQLELPLPFTLPDAFGRRGFGGQRGGVHRGRQSPPTGVRINARKLSLGITDAQQILEEHPDQAGSYPWVVIREQQTGRTYNYCENAIAQATYEGDGPLPES
jgi:hypothetical protein